jgi:ATP-dependent Clp protease ATP-binding subunit ClpC
LIGVLKIPYLVDQSARLNGRPCRYLLDLSWLSKFVGQAMFERYNEKARRVIFFARYEASQFGSPYIETEHLLLGIVREDKALTNRFLRSQVETLRKQVESQTTVRENISLAVDLPLSKECTRVLAYAAEEAECLAHKQIGSEHLFLGLLREERCFAGQILMERGVRLDRVREELARQSLEATAMQGRGQPAVLDELSPYISELVDQTQPLVGRESELDRLIEVLSRFSRKNPVLVGEPGVGKRTIVGGMARRIADGTAPKSLAQKVILVLDLPPLRIREKGGFWYERLDSALVAKVENGSIFFVNRMHDRPAIDAAEPLQRPIMAGKIQCIGTSTPASFSKLQADGHWLAQYFEPIEVAPAKEETAVKVLHGIKGVYETFHNVSYTEDAIAHAVLCASKYIKRGCLPGTAVDLLDEAGAAAQLQQGLLPAEVVEVQKRLRFIAERMEASIASHEFEKARFYSAQERKESDNLRQLREKYKLKDNPALNLRREDIERAVSKLVGMPMEAIWRSRTGDPDESGSTPN